MPKQSAGILLFRFEGERLQVLLVHPGGPIWKNKDIGSWSVPKGEFIGDEEPLAAAIREFEEETGNKINGDFIELKPVKLKSGKIIYAWALHKELDPASCKSNEFEFEWPPKSGKMQRFPEVDRAEWFAVADALLKINPAQAAFIIELEMLLSK